jgi:hypothetical protein
LNGIAPNIFFPTLAIFTKRDGEGGIRIFVAQLPMSVATQLKKPCQSAAVRQDWHGDLEQSDARGGVGGPEMIKRCSEDVGLMHSRSGQSKGRGAISQRAFVAK